MVHKPDRNKQTAVYETVCPVANEKIVEIRHRCGLRVFLLPKKFGIFSAAYGVPFGGIHRTLRDGHGATLSLPSGTAHFLEHKLFENEDGEDTFEKFAVLGAAANAYTSMTRTSYVFTCTEKDAYLSSLAVLLHSVTEPWFTEKNLEKERPIIQEEIALYDDDPSSAVYLELLRAMYGDTPISDNLCGSPRSLQKITPDLLTKVFDGIYRPSNAFLCLCGNVETEDVLRVLDQVFPFGGFPDRFTKTTALQSVGWTEEPTVYRKHIRREMALSIPQFCIGVKNTVISDDAKERLETFAAIAVLCQALFSGSGYFCPSLYEDGLVPDEPDFEYEHCAGLSYIALSGQSEQPEEVFRRFCNYTSKVAKQGIPEEDFRRAQKVTLAHYLRGFDSSEGITSEMLSFLCDGGDLFSYETALQSLTREDICRLASALFREEHFALSVIQ